VIDLVRGALARHVRHTDSRAWCRAALVLRCAAGLRTVALACLQLVMGVSLALTAMWMLRADYWCLTHFLETRERSAKGHVLRSTESEMPLRAARDARSSAIREISR